MNLRARTAPWMLALAWLGVTGCGYNAIQAADEDVKARWAQVENQYQRRLDLVPNLVRTVKGAANFERETLEGVIEARAKATQVRIDPGVIDDPQAFRRFQQAQDGLSSALSRLLVTVERYPELKATQAFQGLQAQLEGTENRIAVERRRYIEAVARYNKLIRQFPTNLTARFLLGAKLRPTFEATPGSERPPEVEF
ncbi:MAG: LemA family protein [Myxococcota bacterium]